MNKISGISLLIAICFQYGCRSFIYSDGGRVESKYRNYYFNDSLNVGAVVYGDMELAYGNLTSGKAKTKTSYFDREVLKEFRIGKSDKLLFSMIPRGDHNQILGLVRYPGNVKLSEYKTVREGKIFFLLKTKRYKDREAYEGLIRLDQNRFLSIVYYLSSKDAVGYLQTLNTIMWHTATRIKDGEMMAHVFSALDDSNNFFEEHGYLAPFKLAEMRNNYPSEQNLVDQLLATYYSFCGAVDLVNKSSEAAMFFKKENLDATDLTPAKISLLKQTKDKQVVMFNTSHHLPQHAYFVGGLLDSLYKQGFTHLALEAIGDPSRVMKTGFLCLDDGFYIKDPVMSNFISKARAIGFEIINYESEADDRELGQAQNLADQLYKTNKDCRLVVLAGYGHVEETTAAKKMAGYFKHLTGIDPFTIDQTKLMTSFCQNLDTGNKEDVFVYTGNEIHRSTDLLLWNNIDMHNKPIGFPFASAIKDITVDIPDLSAERDSLAAFLIYNQEHFLRDSTVVPVFVKVIPVKKATYQLKLGNGKYLMQCLGAYKRLLFKRELIVN